MLHNCFDWLLRDVNSPIDGRKQIIDFDCFIMTSSHGIKIKTMNVSRFVENDRILKGSAL